MKRRGLLIIKNGRSWQALPQRIGGQAALELSVAIICLLVLVAASIKLFVWANRRILLRNDAYERGAFGRVRAGDSTNPLGAIREPDETLKLTR